jgi:Pyoverdine/dityrosine biosynthesis protein
LHTSYSQPLFNRFSTSSSSFTCSNTNKNTEQIECKEPHLATQAQPRPAILSEGPVAQVESTVDKIVEIISGYINQDSADDQFESVGRTGLRAAVSRYVECGEQMELVFPAFPFKSTSLNKVLGLLPDLAEEILLKRLNSLARDISEHHPAGAVVRLVSDGIVYQRQYTRSDHLFFKGYPNTSNSRPSLSPGSCSVPL